MHRLQHNQSGSVTSRFPLGRPSFTAPCKFLQVPAALSSSHTVVAAAVSARVTPLILRKAGTLPATEAVDGEPLRAGHIYVAPPDYHLVVIPGALRVSRSATENRFRPAIDPLFRSAAVAYGPRVVGVLLSGGQDGTAGLWAVKQQEGGLAHPRIRAPPVTAPSFNSKPGGSCAFAVIRGMPIPPGVSWRSCGRLLMMPYGTRCALWTKACCSWSIWLSICGKRSLRLPPWPSSWRTPKRLSSGPTRSGRW
jgi:hypothetical protein